MLRVILIFGFASVALALPEYQCYHPNNKVCRLDNVRVSRTQLHFKIVTPYAKTVEQIILASSEIPVLTADICAQLPQLLRLDATGAGIEEIQEDAIYACAHLKELRVSDNLIQVIAPKVFRNHSAIEYIDLGSNRLRAIEDEQFANLISLQYLFVNFNYITVFPASAVKNNRKLLEVHLNNNDLFDLDENELSLYVVQLQNVQLNYNLFSCSRLEEITARLKKEGVKFGTLGRDKSRVYQLGKVDGLVCVNDVCKC